jgi:lipoate-protein ligase B
VFDLRRTFGTSRSVKAYVEAVEEVVIRFLGGHGVSAFRKPGFPGMWTKHGKIGFVGIRISGGHTLHGFGLNVRNDLSVFGNFLPCNIENCRVTSMLDHGVDITLEEAVRGLNKTFSEVFA